MIKITDEEWKEMEPLMPKDFNTSTMPHREFIDIILSHAISNNRKFPNRAVYQRYLYWKKYGLWPKIIAILRKHGRRPYFIKILFEYN